MPEVKDLSSNDSWFQELEEVCRECGVVLSSYSSVPSTMDVAKQLIAESVHDTWGLVLATTQTSGRGRSHRAWSSPKGGFWATLYFTTSCSPEELSGLSLVIGCALARAAAQCGATLKLKWPNDLLTEEGSKIGGVLVETVSDRKGKTNLFIGTGINLTAVPRGVTTASSLLERYGVGVSPAQFCALYVPHVRDCIEEFFQQGFESFQGEWLEYAYRRYQKIEVSRLSGNNTGLFMGVTAKGELELKTSQGLRTVASGEVSCI
jgi:BirA family transcriptional regulator, biotin operon repressor / biotin---[acetyl-CoA-carboxylase] ligase